MTEEFLHHIWKFKLFNQLNLTTSLGEKVEILKVGDHNFDAGPDFFNARLKIGDTLWAGNIEVHINASDWKKHAHQTNKVYDNIILHVVYNEDAQVNRASNEIIPTIELKYKISDKQYQQYLNFKSNKDWIPCKNIITSVPSIIISSTIDRLLLERLQRKSETIINSLKLNNNNWEETFYQQLAKNFGFKINAIPFELLSKSIPSTVLAKHKNSLLQIEAILFGQAGFLDQHYQDKYPLQLQNEYIFLKQKFKLEAIDNNLWKFLRMRPVNFPTIRIAQFASLIYNSTHLFSKIIEIENYESIKKVLHVGVSEYWSAHYTFNKNSIVKTKHLGDDAINNIIINTIVPFLFTYGKQKNDEKYVDKALTFLEQVEGEKNTIIKEWDNLNMPVKNAYSTQALLQLKQEYCNNKKCLTCAIGNYLIKNS
ncbi:MAG: DUF2851 family protein [Bacteroidia bacterium]